MFFSHINGIVLFVFMTREVRMDGARIFKPHLHLKNTSIYTRIKIYRYKIFYPNFFNPLVFYIYYRLTTELEGYADQTF